MCRTSSMLAGLFRSVRGQEASESSTERSGYAPSASNVDPFARFARRWLVAVLAVAVLVVGVNVFLDPYQIFNLRGFALRDSYTPNEVFNKLEVLLRNPDRYDAFYVGSSRMGMFDPQFAEAIHPGRSYYTLSVLGVEPGQQLAMLRAMVAGKVPIKEVVIGVDLYPFLTRRGDNPAHRPHPAMTGQSRPEFLSGYLFLSSYSGAFSRLVHTFGGEPQIGFDFEGTGRYHLLGYERERAADPDGYVRKHLPDVDLSLRPPGPVRWVEAAFSDLAGIRDFLAENGIRAFWFIHPLHPGVLVNVPLGAVPEFVGRVTQILGPVADFSSDRRFLDSRDYYDYKHYVPSIAQRIVGEVLGRVPGPGPVTTSTTSGDDNGDISL